MCETTREEGRGRRRENPNNGSAVGESEAATVLDPVPPIYDFDGEVSLQQQTPQHLQSLIVTEHHFAAVPPIAIGQYVLAGCQNGDVVAWRFEYPRQDTPISHTVDTLTGVEPTMVWKCNEPSPVTCLLEFTEDVFVATEIGSVHRILFPALKVKHSFQTNRCGISAMLVHMTDKIVLGYSNGALEAYALNGTKLWEGMYENAVITGLASVDDYLVVTRNYQDEERPATAAMVEILDISSLKGQLDLDDHAVFLSPGREIVDVSYLHSNAQYLPIQGANCAMTIESSIVTRLADGSFIEIDKTESGWQTKRQLCLSFPSIGMGQVKLLRNGESVPHAVCFLRSTSTYLIPIGKELPILAFAMPHDLDDDSKFRYVQAASSFVVHDTPVVAYLFSCGAIELFSCNLLGPASELYRELYNNDSFELLRQLLIRGDDEIFSDHKYDAARDEIRLFKRKSITCDDVCFSPKLKAVRTLLLQMAADYGS